MTEWNTGRVLAAVFAVEGFWMVLRALVAIAEGAIFSSSLSFGLFAFGTLIFPGSLFGAAWFLWRQQPPTLMLSAFARTLTVAVALVTTFLFASAAASGHLTFI